jgi:carbamoyl-phosphate synthase large subunit
MTGAGAPGAAGIIKCLQQKWINLTVADADNTAVGKFLNDSFVQIPKAAEDNFISTLLSLCQSKNIHIILPLVTKELLSLATNKSIFEKTGTKILVSSKEAIEIANNKASCYQYLVQKDIPVPAFGIANNIDEFTETASVLGYPKSIFCFKPSHSNGSRGFRIVDDTIDESDQLFNQKPYNTFITYANALRILSLKPFLQLLVTEYLPGDEYSVDCLAQQGQVRLIVPRIRKKMINGISVQGEFINDAAIIDYCTKIIETIGLHGNIGIQVKKRNNGQPLLLEINPRVQGTIVAGLGAGVNLPLLAIKQELEMPIETSEMQPAWGTAFIRHWSEIYH